MWRSAGFGLTLLQEDVESPHHIRLRLEMYAKQWSLVIFSKSCGGVGLPGGQRRLVVISTRKSGCDLRGDHRAPVSPEAIRPALPRPARFPALQNSRFPAQICMPQPRTMLEHRKKACSSLDQRWSIAHFRTGLEHRKIGCSSLKRGWSITKMHAPA